MTEERELPIDSVRVGDVVNVALNKRNRNWQVVRAVGVRGSGPLLTFDDWPNGTHRWLNAIGSDLVTVRYNQ